VQISLAETVLCVAGGQQRDAVAHPERYEQWEVS
jgi:hypothetical protein